jgi:hypothetical protein
MEQVNTSLTLEISMSPSGGLDFAVAELAVELPRVCWAQVEGGG